MVGLYDQIKKSKFTKIVRFNDKLKKKIFRKGRFLSSCIPATGQIAGMIPQSGGGSKEG